MARGNTALVVNRIILGLAFLGVLVIVHLGIQQSRGFDMGCLGFSAPGAVEASFDCSTVVQSGAGSFLGISNVIWGLVFYLTVVALSALVLLNTGRQQLMDRLRAAVVGAGFLYSAYLVYLQFAVIGELCALCLISAGIVALLAAFQLYLMLGVRNARPIHSNGPVSMKKEFRLIGAMAVVVAVLAVADIAYFRSIEPAQAATADSQTPGSRAAVHDPVDQACRYDESRPAIENHDAILAVTDPFAGNPDASVTMIEFFDPNCPHCKTQHQVTKMLVEDFGDRVRFFFKPIPLWPFSVPQIDALYAASQDGKFEDMLSGQFDRQRQGGLDMADLKEIAGDIGMDPNQLEQRIERGIFRSATMGGRQIASDVGLTGVPAVFINGRLVESRSRTPACLAELLEDALD
jgi:protein-disulfide isomerase/uncharacterized membrane protein